MPLASISKVTSVCGEPRCAARIPANSNSKKVVVFGRRAFTLVHLDQRSWPVVGGGREDQRFARGDAGVARDKLGEKYTRGLNTEG